jgi:hypothetical protein
VDVYASSKLDIIATIVDNKNKEVLSKRLGSGKVGISANYTLHNKNVDVDAYADHIQYSTVAEDIEYWINIYNLDLKGKYIIEENIEEENMKNKLSL